MAKSTAYHPQSDGQTEEVDRCIETYLRCMTHERPGQWIKWLPMAEWWYNSNYHTATQLTPFEIVYGTPPPIHVPYFPGDSKIESVDQLLSDRESSMKIMRYHLQRAQNHMKQQADDHRVDRSFEIGDWLFVKLQSYRQCSVVPRSNLKLSHLYYGPFQVEDKIGEVAYKLKLPSCSEIHLVFHISQLQRKVPNSKGICTDLPLRTMKVRSPKAVIDRKVVKRGNKAATKLLIQWEGEEPEDATWEFSFDIQKKYPAFDLGTRS